jgi:DNA-binding response OmpR family regulator
MQRRSLVVDDEPAVCRLIEDVLSTAGMKVLALTESAEAARYLREEKFEVVLLDLRMPAPDGIEVARQMRASGYNRSTPIIMISDDQRVSVVAEGFEAGASFFLYKPIDKARLLHLIRASHGAIEHEKRRFRRIDHRASVHLTGDGVDLNGETVNISMNGMLVKADQCIPLGSDLRVTLDLLPGVKPFVGSGSVARIAGGNEMGIEFNLMSRDENGRLQELLLPLIIQS